MKTLISMAFIAAMSAPAFASTLNCNSKDEGGQSTNLTAVSADGVNYENVVLTIKISNRTTVKKFKTATYDPTYKSMNPKFPNRTAFRLMKSKKMRGGYTLFRDKEVGNSFPASLAEDNAGFHGETEYTFLSCTQK